LFLSKQKRTYHLRISVPPDLADLIGKCELRFSLKCRNKHKAQVGENAFNQALEYLRARKQGVDRHMDELSKQELTKIIRTFVTDSLEGR
jgi:hypothetical protein